ncbi:MAG: helix-turn-helix domain-containing protein [Phycisphaerae bacterium]|nr:helix-turn-helix domain-containing protein [Phycisphaerae bacterium]
MTQRRASRPWEEIRVRVDPPAPQTPSPVSPQPEKPERTLLTSREVAGRLGISERTVWSITAPRGPLPTIRIGRRTMYSVSDLDILVERLKQKPRPRERTPFERANDRHL